MVNETISKTGECKYIDELGNLCIAESFVDQNGEVFTKLNILEKVNLDIEIHE